MIVLNTTLLEAKREMRSRVIERRNNIPADKRASKSIELCNRLLAETTSRISRGSIVAAFYPLGSEADLRPYLLDLFDLGYRVALPAMVKSELRSMEKPTLPDTEKLELPDTVKPEGTEYAQASRASMVFLEMDKSTIESADAGFLQRPAKPLASDSPDLARFTVVEPENMDMVVVPLVAFDSRYNRLGYGGGNYDGFLGKLRENTVVVGAAFEEQKVDTVPLEPHDRPLPAIIFA